MPFGFLRGHPRAADRGCARGDEVLLDLVQAALEASRRSSAAVLSALDDGIRAIDPSIDSVLAFVPAGVELACVHASGSRAEHFRHAALARQACGALPARAAESGCRAIFPAGGSAVIPTDRRALAMPLRDGDRVLAVAYASSPVAPRDAAASERAIERLVRAIERCATPYAIALEREADRTDATHDGLTGLLAPRAFRRLLHEELARAGTRPQTLSLLFVDTDRFKAINDGFGHQAGDAVLQTIATLLASQLDVTGVAARNGGDEFCALIRGGSKSSAIECAVRFCEAVRGARFGIPETVTVSVGVATWPYDASTSSELLEAADAAMYHSKRCGRDRVSFALEPGRFASVAPEAQSAPSRSSSECPGSTLEASCVRSSS